jgi:hypothetical protein
MDGRSGAVEARRGACMSGRVHETQTEQAMLLIILVVVLLLTLGGGGWAHSRYGLAGWSPAGLILLVLVVLWLTGNLHV